MGGDFPIISISNKNIISSHIKKKISPKLQSCLYTHIKETVTSGQVFLVSILKLPIKITRCLKLKADLLQIIHCTMHSCHWQSI